MGTIDTIRPEAATIAPPMRFFAHRNIFGMIRKWGDAVAIRLAKRRSRCDLRDLTEDQLRDIGLTRQDVQAEIGKSFFWD